MNLHVAEPWLLALLPLALLPLIRRSQAALRYSWLTMLPRDHASDIAGWVLRLLCALAVVGIVLGLAGLYRGAQQIERVGRGAEIVLLLDRSRSMDQAFADPRNHYEHPLDARHETKAQVAQHVLSEFATRRPHDQFSMIVFSSSPMRALDFTDKPAAVHGAITAAGLGRGLGDTDMGRALLAALAAFDDRPYNGSRIVMLVSDGGARLDEDTRQRIVRIARRNRVSLYWIYIRSLLSPGLKAEDGEAEDHADSVPEYFLHRFFQTMGTPYHAYEAENPSALSAAIADVDRLERLPIEFMDILPRRDLSHWCYALAAACAVLLALARRLEVRRWA